MKKYQFLLLFAIIASPLLYAQKDSSSRKLSKAESEQLMKTLNVDSSSFLKNSGESACHCIDSIYGTTKDKSKLLEGFSGCIDKEVTGYDLAVKLLNQMTGKDTGNVINVSTNQASVQYKRRYFEI